MSRVNITIVGNTELFSQTMYSITVLERNLRLLSNFGFEKVYLPASIRNDLDRYIRKDFYDLYKIQIDFDDQLSEANQSTIGILSGEFVFDPRLVNAVMTHEKPAFLVNEQEAVCALVTNFNGKRSYANLGSDDTIDRIGFEDINFYNQKLRKIIKPYLLKISNDNEASSAEKIVFDSVYKGATDFVTKHVFPQGIKLAVKMLAPGRITPNMVTYVSIILAFGAIPFYFLGWFNTAIVMSFVMAFLDSLDGKLARIKFQETEGGNYLDHVADYVYLPIWWIATGYHLSDGVFTNEIGLLNVIFLGAYLLDKLIAFVFLRLNQVSISDFKAIDRLVRLFAFRRNPSLIAFLVGLIFFNQALGYKLVVYLMAGTAIFHLLRFIVSFFVEKDSDRKEA